jgi:hypothetical protein
MATVLRLLAELNAGSDPTGLGAGLPHLTGENLSFQSSAGTGSTGSSMGSGPKSWSSKNSSFRGDHSIMMHNTFISEGR